MKKILMLSCMFVLGTFLTSAASTSPPRQGDFDSGTAKVSYKSDYNFSVDYTLNAPDAIQAFEVETPAAVVTAIVTKIDNAKEVNPFLTNRLYLLNCCIRQC